MSSLSFDKFDRSKMFELFEIAGQVCKEKGIFAEIAVYGGSSLMMHETLFDMRRVTEDVDYVSIKGPEALDVILEEASSRLGMDKVFRDDVKELISSKPDYIYFDEYPPGDGNFRVYHCSPEYILAMKLNLDMRSSISSSDSIDVWNLMELLEIDSAEKAVDIVKGFFPFNPITKKNLLILEDMVDLQKSGQEYDPMVAWSGGI